MRATVLQPSNAKDSLIFAAAICLSLVSHLILAGSMSQIKPREHTEPAWVEMEIVEFLPPAEAEPIPEPEAEAEAEAEPESEAEPEEVTLEEIVETPPDPEPVPEEAKPVRKLVQGLSASSFAEGSGTGLTVRAGTTTATKAKGKGLELNEEAGFSTVPVSAVSRPPKLKRKPKLHVPESIRLQKIEGIVEVMLTIGEDGAVKSAKVVRSLHPDADIACVVDLKRSHWKAGIKDGAAVAVSGVPFTCRYENILK